MDLRWSRDHRWDDLFLQAEVDGALQLRAFGPGAALRLFEKFEREAYRLLKVGLVLPGYDHVIKCSHLFNLLDARGAISVTDASGRSRACARWPAPPRARI